jgi:pimeloyl-ACP methyl ester carboxylesterase
LIFIYWNSRKNFWKQGLQLAWGDPKKVSDSDALRFQWPSIGAGWERGLIKFAQAQARPTLLTDSELLQEVLKLENTTVAVIYGSNDRVVSSKIINKFFQTFPQVPLVELDGLGHDPFEEDTEGFVQVVEELLEKWNTERQ